MKRQILVAILLLSAVSGMKVAAETHRSDALLGKKWGARWRRFKHDPASSVGRGLGRVETGAQQVQRGIEQTSTAVGGAAQAAGAATGAIRDAGTGVYGHVRQAPAHLQEGMRRGYAEGLSGQHFN